MFPPCSNGWQSDMTGIDWSPLLPLPAFAGLALLLIGLAVWVFVCREAGALIRLLTGILILAALAGPSFVMSDSETVKDVVAVAVDRSGSQGLSVRTDQTEAALKALRSSLAGLPGLDVRVIDPAGQSDDGTPLFASVKLGLADVAPERVGAVFLITDGLVDDVPKSLEALGQTAPVHALVTGFPKERDRRIELIDTPQFGIVGKEQTIRLRLNDTGGTDPVTVTMKRDGEVEGTARLIPGQSIGISVRIAHGGLNIFEFEAEADQGELTTINNRAIVAIDGIRDRLKVLLVSGEPHPGERTWRNTLKSDANVDLVHFTILRPPEKQDATPITELSLIAFPTRELFETRIADFDMIIFDRYSDLAILPPAYFNNIVRYVRNGGALFIAAGPEFAGPDSPAETYLRSLLPALPDGQIIERPFLPRLTDAGKRHPVTRGLPGSGTEPPRWGEWTRQISAIAEHGTTVMSGANESPLLVLAHEEKGRVALLLSDHAWLWAREFRGGGPHLDLLRRTGHWLMKEPDLDEEALRANFRNGRLAIERQTMGDTAKPVTVTTPMGKDSLVMLAEAAPGLWRADFAPSETGLYRLSDGKLTAFAAVGPTNPREFQTVVSTTTRLEALTRASGGSVRRIAETAEDPVSLPAIIRIGGGGLLAGQSFIGIRATNSTLTKGISLFPLFAGFAGLVLISLGVIASWTAEGRGFRFRRPQP